MSHTDSLLWSLSLTANGIWLGTNGLTLGRIHAACGSQ